MAVQTDAGTVRENNEDRIAFVTRDGAAGGERPGFLAIVADGMGGHQSGEVASGIAATQISRAYLEAAGEPPAQFLGAALINANAAIYAESLTDLGLQGMGTTCTLLLVENGDAWSANVGDSRIWRVRGPTITQLTDDDTLVRHMVREGLLTPEQAEVHPDSNLLTKAVGTHPAIEIEVASASWPVDIGDIYVLASDGLHDVVSAEEIHAVVTAASTEAACDQLIAMAKDKGSADNISVGVIAIVAPRSTTTSGPPTTRVLPR